MWTYALSTVLSLLIIQSSAVEETCSCADITSRLKCLESKLDRVEKKLDGGEKKLDGGEKKLHSVEEKLDRVEEKLDMLVDLKTQAHSDEYFDIMNTGNKEWRLAFRGTPYINKSVYEAYKSGTGAHDNVEPGCKQLDGTLPCENHYRNNYVFDNWAYIDKVALVLYDGNIQVKHMIFNGQGSTYMDWLSQARLELSSWTDAKTEKYNYFSIEGDSHHQRRFSINRYYNGCPNDEGWFVALDPGVYCLWESVTDFPVFKYSKGDTYTNWTTGNVGTASLMAIFVKYTT